MVPALQGRPNPVHRLHHVLSEYVQLCGIELVHVEQPFEAEGPVRSAIHSLPAQVVDVCANEADRQSCQLLQIDVLAHGHAPSVNLEDLKPALAVGNGTLYDPLEPAGAVDCRIDIVQPVGRTDHYDLPPLLHSIEQGQQL